MIYSSVYIIYIHIYVVFVQKIHQRCSQLNMTSQDYDWTEWFPTVWESLMLEIVWKPGLEWEVNHDETSILHCSSMGSLIPDNYVLLSCTNCIVMWSKKWITSWIPLKKMTSLQCSLPISSSLYCSQINSRVSGIVSTYKH